MDFGLFNLMGYRTEGASTREILQDTVEKTKIADQGGMGVSWFAEHHFSNYGICGSPLMMAANCAPQTKRIKLASGILVMPLYSPVRVVEEIAMVDALSEGRLIVGVGTGYQFGFASSISASNAPDSRHFVCHLSSTFFA
jgi:alkanesulfonate monooxygenase SsuD/methylene tetrahydromethanopterin reductase-like flavin-dependent oxidoreductase (luciferase family)